MTNSSHSDDGFEQAGLKVIEYVIFSGDSMLGHCVNWIWLGCLHPWLLEDKAGSKHRKQVPRPDSRVDNLKANFLRALPCHIVGSKWTCIVWFTKCSDWGVDEFEFSPETRFVSAQRYIGRDNSNEEPSWGKCTEVSKSANEINVKVFSYLFERTRALQIRRIEGSIRSTTRSDHPRWMLSPLGHSLQRY